MASTRLTAEIRAAIAEGALKSLKNEFSAAEKEMKDSVNKACLSILPAKVLAAYNDKDNRGYLNGYTPRIRCEDGRHFDGSGVIPWDGEARKENRFDPAVIKRLREMDDKIMAIRKRIDEAARFLNGMLTANRTVEQLIDAWPEVVDFLPPIGSEGKGRLPAVRSSDLNKLLGIPSKTKS